MDQFFSSADQWISPSTYLYILQSQPSTCPTLYLSYVLSIYVLQVNQAVSDFSNERDKVVGQLREAEVASTINSLFAFH